MQIIRLNEENSVGRNRQLPDEEVKPFHMEKAGTTDTRISYAPKVQDQVLTLRTSKK